MKNQNHSYIHVLILLASVIACEAVAAPPFKDITATIINTPDDPLPVDVRAFSDNPPIPFEFIGFPRQYCASWKRTGVISENETRRLVEYEAILPTIRFDQEVFWQGGIYGGLFGTAEHVSIGHTGKVPVVTACVGDSPSITYDGNFLPRLIAGNQYEIDTVVSGFACFFDGIYPVDIRVQAWILEHKNLPLPASVATGDEGDGNVCFSLLSVDIPRGD